MYCELVQKYVAQYVLDRYMKNAINDSMQQPLSIFMPDFLRLERNAI